MASAAGDLTSEEVGLSPTGGAKTLESMGAAAGFAIFTGAHRFSCVGMTAPFKMEATAGRVTTEYAARAPTAQIKKAIMAAAKIRLRFLDGDAFSGLESVGVSNPLPRGRAATEE
jgi:hypothetical protein